MRGAGGSAGVSAAATAGPARATPSAAARRTPDRIGQDTPRPGRLRSERARFSNGVYSQEVGLSRWVAVYRPTVRPSFAPTSVLLWKCMPPHTRALPSSAETSAALVYSRTAPAFPLNDSGNGSSIDF